MRFVLVLVTWGSNDILIWEKFGRHIAEWGVLEEYVRTPAFNHPPLMGSWSELCFEVGRSTFVPFRIAFKLLPLTTDVLCTWGIWRVVRRQRGTLAAWRAAAVFSTCLVSILITGFHGNTDSTCAATAFLATALVAEGRSPLLAGIALGAALNVKLIPLVLLPGLFLQLRDLRTMARFSLGLALALLPLAVPAVMVKDAFYSNVIAYNSMPERWGIHFLLDSFAVLTPWTDSVRRIDEGFGHLARFAILASSLGIGAWARWHRRTAFEVTALVFAMFLVLAPGIGVQYLIYAVPALVIVDLRRAVLYGTVAGLFLGAVYSSFLTGDFPIRSWHRPGIPIGTALIGLGAWLALVELLITRLFFSKPESSPLSGGVRTTDDLC